MELSRGIIFSGTTGEYLTKVLSQILGITEQNQAKAQKLIDQEIFFTNAIQCLPRKKEPAKLQAATHACRNRLIDEISAYPRKVVIAMGNAALWGTTGNYSYKITKVRGKNFPSPLAEYGIFSAVHPNFILRGGGNPDQFKKDLAYAIHVGKGGKPKEFIEPDYTVLETPEEVAELAEQLRALPDNTLLAGDIETSGFDHLSDYILCLGVAHSPDHVTIIPGELITNDLFKNRCRWVWHNGKFDVKFLRAAGCEDAYVHEDTMLLSYALCEKGGIHDLDQVASDWIGAPEHKAMLEKHLPKKGASYALLPKRVLYPYLSYDVAKTLLMYYPLKEAVQSSADLTKCYNKVLIPASEYLSHVENNGFAVDEERVKENEAAMEAEANELVNQLNVIARRTMGRDINPNSPKQLKELLYETLKLGPPSLSTDVDTLEGLPQVEAVQILRKYRKVYKGLSTYVRPALEHRGKDGRIHPTFKIHGTTTGRLASSDPNMQNIPRLPSIRGQYVAAPGKVLLECDLNQAELRSLATLSLDPELIRIYSTDGLSLHEEVRAEIWRHPKDWTPEEVQAYMTKFYCTEERIVDEQKMRAKALNFGIIYGRQAPSIAEEFAIEVSEAQGWITKWFNKFKVAGQFIEKCRNAASKGQTITTCFGRKRRFHQVARDVLQSQMNEACNFPHQSIASDIVLLSGVELESKLRKEYDTKIVNTVHDCLISEVPDDPEVINQVAKLVMNTMESVPKEWGLNVIPFISECKVGKRWGSLKTYHPY